MIEIPEGGFQVVLADPPWRYANWSDTSRGAQQAHYPGMTYAQMAELTPFLSSIFAYNMVSVMWGTWPKADEAMDLCREKTNNGIKTGGWPCKYVTGFPWIKVSPGSGRVKRGVGFWAMGASEFCFISRRQSTRKGAPKLKAEKLDKNVIGLLCGSERQFYDRIGQHSRKPYGIAQYLEDRFPGVPKLELFATEEREGWTCIGHRTGYHITPEGIITVDEAKAQGRLPKNYDPFAEPKRKLPPKIKDDVPLPAQLIADLVTPVTSLPLTVDHLAGLESAMGEF